MTKRWWKKTEPLYRRFSHLGRDASEAQEFYMAETFGKKYSVDPKNRYAAGKRNMDLTVSLWKEDITAKNYILTKGELLEDKTFRGIL